MEMGRGHAERGEDVVARPVGERLAADPGDDLGQESEAGVGVHVARAGREVQLPLAADPVEEEVLGQDVVHALARHDAQLPLVVQAAGVVEQVQDGDLGPEIGHLGQVLADVVAGRELAGRLEHGDGQGRELLGYGGDMEDRRRRDGDAVFELGAAETLAIDNQAVLDYGHGTAGCVEPLPLGEQGIDLGFEGRLGGCRGLGGGLGLGRPEGQGGQDHEGQRQRWDSSHEISSRRTGDIVNKDARTRPKVAAARPRSRSKAQPGQCYRLWSGNPAVQASEQLLI